MCPFFKQICLSLFICMASSTINAQENNKLINSGIVIEEGSRLHDEKKYKEAIEEYKKVDRSDTNYVNALYELSYSYYADSQFLKSLECAEMGLKLFPNKYSMFCMQAANCLDDLNRPDEAITFYDNGLKKNPNDYLLHFNKGLLNYKLKKYDEAKLNLQNCLLINPYYSSAHYFLGSCYMNQGNLVAALLAYKTYLLTAPSGRYFSNTVTYLSNISKVTDEVLEYAKNKNKTGSYFFL